VGHLQVVTGLSDQLYRKARSVHGEFWGKGAGRDLIITVGAMVRGFIRQVTISSFVVPLFQSGYYSYARDII